jgi:hypothetical protein
MNDTKSSISTNFNSFLSKESESNFENNNQSEENDDFENIIIDSISFNLENLIRANQNIAKNCPQDIFFLSFIPSISLNEYIRNLVKQTNMEISTLILAVIYIDRFCYKYDYTITKNNIFRILLITCLLSLKFNQDSIITNEAYSKIACISVQDLKILEIYMYFKLKFSLMVKDSLYKKYYNYFKSGSSQD